MEKLARYPKIGKTLLKASGNWSFSSEHRYLFLLLSRLNNSIDHLWQVARPAGFERIMYRQETVPKAPFIDKVEVRCASSNPESIPTFFQVCRDGVILHPWHGWVCLLKWVLWLESRNTDRKLNERESEMPPAGDAIDPFMIQRNFSKILYVILGSVQWLACLRYSFLCDGSKTGKVPRNAERTVS